MFGVSKSQYVCGLRTGHDFACLEVKQTRRFGDIYKMFRFQCRECGFVYSVYSHELNSKEREIVKKLV